MNYHIILLKLIKKLSQSQWLATPPLILINFETPQKSAIGAFFLPAGM